MEDMEESSGSNSPLQIPVFDRIEILITQASMFNRLGNFNQVERNSTHIPQRSIQQRIGTLPWKSWLRNPKKKRCIKLKQDAKRRSLILSWIKHHSTWKIYTNGSLKVKRHTIVITKQLDEECLKDIEENSMHTSYHVTMEVDSDLEYLEDEPTEAP